MQPASTDRGPTVQEIIAAEARLLESIYCEVGTYSPADWVHLLAARFSLKAEQLLQRTPPAVRSPLSLTVVPVEVMRSGALRVVAGFARDCSLCARHHTELPWVLRVVCHVFALGVVFFVQESGGIGSALARVALLNTDLLPSPLSLVTVALAPFNFSSFQLCVLRARVRTDDEG